MALGAKDLMNILARKKKNEGSYENWKTEYAKTSLIFHILKYYKMKTNYSQFFNFLLNIIEIQF